MLPNLAKSIAQALQGRFWRNAHWRKEQEALCKPCKRRDLASTISWASRCRATWLNRCRRNVYVATQAVLQREMARDVIVRGPYFTHRCIAAKPDCRFFDITWYQRIYSRISLWCIDAHMYMMHHHNGFFFGQGSIFGSSITCRAISFS